MDLRVANLGLPSDPRVSSRDRTREPHHMVRPLLIYLSAVFRDVRKCYPQLDSALVGLINTENGGNGSWVSSEGPCTSYSSVP